MRLAAAILLVVGGCDQAFGITRVGDLSGDAAPPPVHDGATPVDACTGHDEDHDGVPDACDPCPAQAAMGDADHDGVGDACDPFPTMGGDTRVFFDGFDTMMNGWVPSDPTSWTWTGDDLAGTDSGSGSTATIATAIPSSLDATVDATFDYKFVLAEADAGVQLAFGPGQPVRCLVMFTGLEYEVLISDNGTTEGMPAKIDGTGSLRLVLTHLSDSTFRCSFTEGSTTGSLSGGSRSAPTTQIGLAAYAGEMTVHSIAVFER